MIPQSQPGVVVYVVPETFESKDGSPLPSEIQGLIHIKKPTMTERFSYLDQCGFALSGKGEVEHSGNNFKSLVKMVELALPHIIHFDITVKADGRKIDNMTDFSTAPECDALSFRVAEMVMQGFRPSKN